MWYGGVDLGKRSSVIVVLTAEGEQVLEVRVATMADSFRRVFAKLNGRGEVACEASGQEGVAIWVYVTWDKCVRVPCFIFWDQVVWGGRDGWHKCSAQGRNANVPRDFVWFDVKDLAGISAAIPGCLKEARMRFASSILTA